MKLFVFVFTILLSITVIAQETPSTIKQAKTYLDQAEKYTKGLEYKAAISLYNQAMTAFQANKQTDLLSEINRRIAALYLKLKEYDNAKLYYQAALALDTAEKDFKGERIDHFQLASVFQALLNYESAYFHYLSAYQIDKNLSNNPNIANDLVRLGHIAIETGRLEQAETYLEKAITLTRWMRQWSLHVEALCYSAWIYFEKGKPLDGMTLLNGAAKAIPNLDERHVESILLVTIANGYERLGKHHLALEKYALAFAKEISENHFAHQANILYHWASYLTYLGSYEEANKKIEMAIDLFKKSNATPQGVLAQLLKAKICVYQNKWDSAKIILDALWTETTQYEDTRIPAEWEMVSGLSQYFQKKYSLAKSYFDRAEKLFKSQSQRHLSFQVNYYQALSELYASQWQSALEFSSNAKEGFSKIGDVSWQLKSIILNANIHHSVGNYPQAKILISHATLIAEHSDFHLLDHELLLLRGYISLNSNEYEKFLDTGGDSLPLDPIDEFKKAIVTHQNLGFPSGPWEAYLGIAKVYERKNDYTNAIAYQEKALETIQENPISYLFGIDPPSYLNLVDNLYSLYQKEPEKDYLRKAFRFSEKYKLRQASDVFRLATKSNGFLISQKWLDQESRLKEIISTALIKLSKWHLRSDERVTLNQLIKKAQLELNNVRNEIIKRFPKYAAFHYHLPPSLEEIQLTLNSKKLFLSYLTDDSDVWLFLVSSKDLQATSFTLSANSKASIEELLSYVKSPLAASHVKDFYAASRTVYKEFIRGIDSPKNWEQLIISPDGLLYDIPFEALISTHTLPQSLRKISYLWQQFHLTYIPNATIHYLLYSHPPQKVKTYDLLALAHPDYELPIAPTDVNKRIAFHNAGFETDDRSTTYLTMNSLSHVKQLIKHFPKKRVHVNIGQKATKPVFMRAPLSDYSTIYMGILGLIPGVVNDSLEPTLLFSPSSERETSYMSLTEMMNLQMGSHLMMFPHLKMKTKNQHSRDSGEGFILFSLALLMENTSSFIYNAWAPHDRAHGLFLDHFFKSLHHTNSHGRFDLSLTEAREKLMKTRIEIDAGGQFDDALTEKEIMEFGRSKLFISCAHPYFWAGYRLVGVSSIR